MSRVEKLGISRWESRGKNSGKASTFLTETTKYCTRLWEKFGFTRVLHTISTTISTEILFGFYGVKYGGLHIST